MHSAEYMYKLTSKEESDVHHTVLHWVELRLKWDSDIAMFVVGIMFLVSGSGLSKI